MLIQQLKTAMHAAGVIEKHSTTRPVQEPLSAWDEIVNEPVPGGPNPLPEDDEEPANVDAAGPIQVEDQIISLPSNENVGPEYTELELSHRISHAEHHLNRIRDLIAEKSFQYSHVIRVAPRKAVNTRSRAEVKKINLEISVQCRLYSHCRSRLMKLGASPETVDRFKVLTIEDIKASTAIVNPNEPGSTQLKLSWIWQYAGGHRWGLADANAGAGGNAVHNVIECTFIFIFRQKFFTLILYSSSCSLATCACPAPTMGRRGYIDWLRNAVDS